MMTLNLLDEATASRAERATNHARRVNARLERDVPLLLRAGVVAPVSSRDASERLDRSAAAEAAKQGALRASQAELVGLWRRTLDALRVEPTASPHAPKTPVYLADALHNAARNAVPWVHHRDRFLRCERCGAVGRRPADAEVRDKHESAFIVVHSVCPLPAYAGDVESGADVVIDHDATDGTTVWAVGGHWHDAIRRALGPRADWSRAYGKAYVPVLASRGLARPAPDMRTVADALRGAGARVFITPAAAARP